MFKIKDLMVRVIPEDGLPDLGGAGGCEPAAASAGAVPAPDVPSPDVGIFLMLATVGNGAGFAGSRQSRGSGCRKAQLKERVAAVEMTRSRLHSSDARASWRCWSAS